VAWRTRRGLWGVGDKSCRGGALKVGEEVDWVEKCVKRMCSRG